MGAVRVRCGDDGLRLVGQCSQLTVRGSTAMSADCLAGKLAWLTMPTRMMMMDPGKWDSSKAGPEKGRSLVGTANKYNTAATANTAQCGKRPRWWCGRSRRDRGMTVMLRDGKINKRRHAATASEQRSQRQSGEPATGLVDPGLPGEGAKRRQAGAAQAGNRSRRVG